MTPPVFNAQQMAALTLNDARLQLALLSAFLRQLPGLQADLAAAADTDDTVFGELVHRLKGTAHFVAGERLLALLRDVEAGPLPASATARAQLARDIGEELAALGAAVAQALRAQPAAGAA